MGTNIYYVIYVSFYVSLKFFKQNNVIKENLLKREFVGFFPRISMDRIVNEKGFGD